MSTQGQLTIALAIATPGTGWGGMEKHTADLADALAAKGHEVHVLAHVAHQDRFADPVKFHPLPFQLGRRNLWLRYCFRRTLRSIRPDILHAQGNKAASLVSSRANHARATVGTLHGTKSSHKAFDKLNGVIGVSREITDAIDHPNARLIFNGLQRPDPGGESLASPDFAIPDQRPLLVAAGRLEPVKQFDRLIRAWARADCDGKLVILGEGSQRARLDALIRELELTDCVLLPGHESCIQLWLQAATACIITSSREGFPYIMVEALMAGCPVLSTPVSGVRDFLPDSCIAVSDSVDDIAGLIRTSLTAPDSLAGLQENAFEQARAQLTLETMVAKTEAFYRDLLASVPARR
ncbi:glycosyltransferase [Marinobacter sp. HL-58]|uniref:glycosyltransferase n=1 Tax=Marinobacter sp. HL-58 TaxID=1479237 RepID=UPI000489C2B6|nr:glycosyltransferase [Marinobacter sp. HL-58]KPQ01924.1 MAG: Glycosyltransferase [Marinobacter sp. HL-58]